MKEELKNWITVEEYAKREGITVAGVHYRIANKIIDHEDIILFPHRVKILIKKKKST